MNKDSFQKILIDKILKIFILSISEFIHDRFSKIKDTQSRIIFLKYEHKVRKTIANVHERLLRIQAKQPKEECEFIESESKSVFRKFYERLIRIEGEPREISLGFALGIFIGMTPTMGFQMPIAAFFAAFLGCSKIASVLGVWITNPVTAPLIYGICYFIGAKLLDIIIIDDTPVETRMTFIHEMVENAPDILWATFVGGIILGIPLAIGSYHLSYYLVKKYREEIKQKVVWGKEKIASFKKKEKC